jgi:outer membrane protein assembly factor BamB
VRCVVYVAMALTLPWCGRAPGHADAQSRDVAVAVSPQRYIAMLGSDAQHTGRTTARGPVREPVITWRVRTRRRVFASPVLDDHGRIVFASLDGSVLGVDSHGVVRWAYTSPERVFSSPAVSGDLVVFGHDGDRVVAVDTRGQMRWTVDTPDDADAPPVVGSDGTIYFASREVLALGVNGTVRWRVPLRSHAFGAPALSSSGTLYVTELSGTVTLLRATDGAQVARVETPAAVYGGALVLDDGGFVVGGADGHVRAYHRDATAHWDFPTTGLRDAPGVRATPALTRSGTVVFGADDGGIYGIRASDGTSVFRLQTGNPVRSAARIDADDRIYIGSQDDQLRCLDSQGTLLWSVNIGADMDGTPVILPDETIAIGADDGALYGLHSL